MSPTTVADDDDDNTTTTTHHDDDGGHVVDSSPSTWMNAKESPSPEHPSVDPPAPDCATRCGSLMPPTSAPSVAGGDGEKVAVEQSKGTPTTTTTTVFKEVDPVEPTQESSSRSDDDTLVPSTTTTTADPVLPTTPTITAANDEEEVVQSTTATTTTEPTSEVSQDPLHQRKETETVVVVPPSTQPSTTSTSSVACISIDRRLMSLLPTDAGRSSYEEMIHQVQLVFNWFHDTSEWAKATKGQEDISSEDQAKAESLQIEVKSQVENITSRINSWRSSVGVECSGTKSESDGSDITTFSDPQLRARITFVSEDLDQELTQLRLQQHRIKSSLYSIAWAA